MLWALMNTKVSVHVFQKWEVKSTDILNKCRELKYEVRERKTYLNYINLKIYSSTSKKVFVLCFPHWHVGVTCIRIVVLISRFSRLEVLAYPPYDSLCFGLAYETAPHCVDSRMHLCLSLVGDPFGREFLFLVSPLPVRVVSLNLGITWQNCSQFQVAGRKKCKKKTKTMKINLKTHWTSNLKQGNDQKPSAFLMSPFACCYPADTVHCFHHSCGFGGSGVVAAVATLQLQCMASRGACRRQVVMAPGIWVHEWEQC